MNTFLSRIKIKPNRLLIGTLLIGLFLLNSIGNSQNEFSVKSYKYMDSDLSDLTKFSYTEFEKLPNSFREKLNSEGWTLYISGEEIEDIYDLDYVVYGLTDVKKRAIFIESSDVIMHELVHAAFFNVDTLKTKLLKAKGVEKEIEDSDLDSYYKSSYDEYIIESISRYLEDSNYLNDYPITKEIADEMLKGAKWIYE